MIKSDVKLITAGRSNIALVLKDNTVYFLGKTKGGHFDKSNSEDN